MSATSKLIPRRAEEVIREALGERRVVLVAGPRQCGKSTLTRFIASSIPGSAERRLDDLPTLERAENDPAAFVQHDGLLVIDEVQRAPDLLLAIKQEVDLNPEPGRFLLTGSADILAMARTRESLAGRVEIIDLHPFSQGEIDGAPDGLIPRLLAPAFTVDGIVPTDDRAGYLERAARGGYPEAHAASERSRTRFFGSYLQTLLQRDAREISRIRDPSQLETILRVLVDRHAAPLSLESAARDAALPRSTFEDHLALLQRLFLVRFLPAFATSATKRAMKQRKVLIADSGLATWLAGWNTDPDAASAGRMIEGLALQELMRQASWLDPRIRLSHYRSKDGAEVDLVIEGPDRSVTGVEVKSSGTPRTRDFRHLHHLRNALGPRFRRGVVLHTGEVTASYGDDMWALPVSAIWTAGPRPEG